MDTIGSLGFLSPHTDKPYFTINAPGIPSDRHGDYYDIPVRMRDGRAWPADRFGLDRTGFALMRWPTAADFSDDDRIVATAYPEAQAYLRGLTGAAHVLILDHTVRSSAAGHIGRGIVNHAHNDYTPASAMAHAARLATGAGLTGPHRVMQVNIWRPLSEPVLAAPLAVADGASVRPEDLILCPLIYPDRRGEVYELRYHPDQTWFWFPEMMRDEVLVFKGHDSDESAIRHVPHSAFALQGTGPDTPPRRSIEMRCFCYIPKET